MNKTTSVVTLVIKILLLLLGALMLIGGGACVASNTYFIISSLPSFADLGLFFTLMGISAIVAVTGWWLIRLSRSTLFPRASKTADTETIKD